MRTKSRSVETRFNGFKIEPVENNFSIQDPDAIPEEAVGKHLRWCYFVLNKTSRSFAFVIRELGPELRDAVA